MELDELLNGDESVISDWLRERNLLHECNCGYDVYDPDNVNAAVQEEYGDSRCDDIYDWACQLANHFGWLFVESSRPEHGIYHCQYCEDSEWSLFLDIATIASAKEESLETPANEQPGGSAQPKVQERLIVYLDESYSPEYPRHDKGSFVHAAFIISQSQVSPMEESIRRIMAESYRGSPPKELKYKEISKRPGLLERVGSKMVEFFRQTPDVAVIGIFVPRSGYFGERRRSIEAVSHYSGKPASELELTSVESPESIEEAVRTAGDGLAHVIASCIANYIGAQSASATIVFDPRSKEQDQPLIRELEALLPKTPIDVPCLRHGDAIVAPWPSANTETLGDRIDFDASRQSREVPGLQIADFLAGDIRVFFGDAEDLLDEAISSAPLVNRRVLFPQFFKAGQISQKSLAKLQRRTGKSFLPLYRCRLVNGLLSYYTRNGQMRNLDTNTGQVFDIMD
jgi:hypothetical protein